MNRYLTTLSSLLLLTTQITVSAATWIVDFTGEPGDFRLERGHETLPVEIYRELRLDDRLSVLKEGSVVILKRDDGSRFEVHKGHSPHTIQDSGKAPEATDNWRHGLLTWLRQQHQSDADRPVVPIYTRGDSPPLSLPLAPNATARLGAGKRSLYLAWQGGEPPYEMRLIDSAGKPIWQQANIDAPGGNLKPFETAPLSLQPGRYHLIIRDGGGHQEDVKIKVTKNVPRPLPAAGGEHHRRRDSADSGSAVAGKSG